MKPSHLGILIAFNVLWAGTLSVYKTLEPPLTYSGIVTLRFAVAAISLLLVWPLLPGKAPRGFDLLKTAIMGAIVFVLGHRLQVLGNHLGSAGNSSVLMALEPLLTSIAAAIFLREHIAPRRWIGFSLGMGGVALLNGIWKPDFQWTSLSASLIFVSSFLCETAYSIIGKPLIERAAPAKILALALISATMLNLALDGHQTLAAARKLPAILWLAFIYLGTICTAIGYVIWYVVIRETDVNVAVMTVFVQPVAGMVIAALFLDERLHWGQLWGSVAIVAGLVIGLWRNGRAAHPEKAATEDRV